MAGKQLEVLKETVPQVSRVAVLWNPATSGNAGAFKQAQRTAEALHMELLPLEARSLNDIDGAFAVMRAKRPGALLILPDVMFVTYRARLVELAAKSRLPAM